ncbi:MAG: methylenetetrahydrofolate reductase [NAD(P)H] [Phycisphaerales bacterium]|nr:methylenetetrahydrofolate reductase [NAD(P)H] [Phycisphaerales bacterium]
MRFDQILADHRPSISFEFFPPKSDEAARTLYSTVSGLEPLGPSFVSVTYGAGGSTRDRTRELVLRLRRDTTLTTVPHLTCVNSSRREIAEILQSYVEGGVENVLALRGDLPPGAEHFEPPADGFRYASDLVAFIRKEFPALGIGVAGYPEGHPETTDKMLDLDNLKRKVDAGADVVITQLFFDNRDFYDFVERCELVGISKPIVAGIMPIQSIAGVKRMASLSGARLPAELLRALARAGDDDERVASVGAHWAADQCRRLLDHQVRGLHFYTLNRSAATRRIYESLGIKHSHQLRA